MHLCHYKYIFFLMSIYHGNVSKNLNLGSAYIIRIRHFYEYSVPSALGVWFTAIHGYSF